MLRNLEKRDYFNLTTKSEADTGTGKDVDKQSDSHKQCSESSETAKEESGKSHKEAEAGIIKTGSDGFFSQEYNVSDMDMAEINNDTKKSDGICNVEETAVISKAQELKKAEEKEETEGIEWLAIQSTKITILQGNLHVII